MSDVAYIARVAWDADCNVIDLATGAVIGRLVRWVYVDPDGQASIAFPDRQAAMTGAVRAAMTRAEAADPGMCRVSPEQVAPVWRSLERAGWRLEPDPGPRVGPGQPGGGLSSQVPPPPGDPIDPSRPRRRSPRQLNLDLRDFLRAHAPEGSA